MLSTILVATIACASVVAAARAAAADGKTAAPTAASRQLSFNGASYVHRWSKGGQHEFTPPNDANLDRWQDMVTLNVHESARDGDQLAAVANQVVGNYKAHGKIIRTDSKPRTPQQPAEHLIVAVLGNPEFLEAAFARFMLRDGVGVVAVYSHRIYGKAAGNDMSAWLQSNGPEIEKALMAWNGMPAPATLRQLPQSK